MIQEPKELTGLAFNTTGGNQYLKGVADILSDTSILDALQRKRRIMANLVRLSGEGKTQCAQEGHALSGICDDQNTIQPWTSLLLLLSLAQYF